MSHSEFASERAEPPQVAWSRPAHPPSPWRGRVLAFGCGIVGVFLGLILWHLYTDHLAFHAIVNLINENAAKAQQAAPQP